MRLKARKSVAQSSVGDLLSERRIDGFTELLAAYRAAGHDLQSAVDGGAGAGTTANAMLPHLTGDVYAFEPFVGNHRFFEDLDPRIHLIPRALGNRPGAQSFRVSSVVTPDSAWGQQGLTGYSSAGRLVSEEQAGDYTVECVRGDDEIDEDIRVDFIKLDLQGGELHALRGMPRLLSAARFLYVEYIGSGGLFDFLVDNGFALLDTEYMFKGEPGDAVRAHFEVSRTDITLSSGVTAWTGFRRAAWDSYATEFQRLRKDFGLVHTDLVCVKKDRLDEFEHAMRFLS